MEQKIKARIVLAHADTNEQQIALPNELILYDFEKPLANNLANKEIRLRIGDGTTPINILSDLTLDNMNFYNSKPANPETGDVWYNEAEETFYLENSVYEEVEITKENYKPNIYYKWLTDKYVLDTNDNWVENQNYYVLKSNPIKLSHVIENIEDGLGEKSIQTTAEQPQAYGNYSVALGYNNMSGAKAFSLQNRKYESGDITQKRYYLNSVEGIAKGDEFSIVLKDNYDYLGKITDIDDENKYVTVDIYEIPNANDANQISNDSYLLIPSKPTIGDKVIGTGAYAEGSDNKALGFVAHAEGHNTLAAGKYSHAEGVGSKAGYAAHAEGSGTYAKFGSHAEGEKTEALGSYSHAEGQKSKALSLNSHAEGQDTEAKGQAAHSEGYKTKANGTGAHAEGQDTIVERITSDGKIEPADGAHAEGYKTTASGNGAHAEGTNTTASGNYSHAEGSSTMSKGPNSHAEGTMTIAKGKSQHVQGKYNIEDTEATERNPEGKYAHIVGNGTSTKRSNAHTLDWDGNAWFAGNVEATAADVNEVNANNGNFEILKVDEKGEFNQLIGVQGEFTTDLIASKLSMKGNIDASAHTIIANQIDANYIEADDLKVTTKIEAENIESNKISGDTIEANHLDLKHNIGEDETYNPPSLLLDGTTVIDDNLDGYFNNLNISNDIDVNRKIKLCGENGDAWFAKGIVLGGSDLENYDGIVPRFRGSYNFLNEINNPEQGDIAFLTNQQVEKIYTGFLISKILNSHADTYINFPIDNEAYPCLINDFYGNLYTKIISYLLGEEIYQEFPLKAPNENKTFDFKEDNLVLSFVFGDYPNIQLNLKVNKVVINSTSPFPGTDYENNYYNGYLKIYGNWDSHDLSIEKISNRLFSDEDVTISSNREIVEDSIPEDLRKYLAFEQKRLHEFYFYADNEWRRMYNTEDGELYVRYPQMNYCGTIDSLPQDEVDIGSVYTLNYQEIKEFDQEVKISNNKIQISNKVYPEIIKYLWTDILQIEENLARNSLKDTTYHFTFPNDKIYLGVNIEDVWYDFNLISLYISYPSSGINAPGLSTITGTFLKNNNIFYFNDSINIDKIKIGKYIDNSRSYKDLFMFDGDIWRKFYYSYNVPKTLLEKGEGKNSLQRIGVSQSIGDYSIDFGVSTKVYNVSSKEEEEIYKDWNNEKFGLILGKNSVNLGTNNLVGGENNIANGTNNFIHGYNNYVEGYNNTVFAETKEGKYIGGTGLEESNHIEGINNTAYVDFEFFESVTGMHQEGCNTISSHVSGSHVGGVYNKPDDNNEFIRVIGNGACDSEIYGYSYEDYKADNNSFDNFNDNCKVIQNISRRNNGLTLGLNGELNIDKMVTLTDNHYATIYDCGSGEKFPIDVKPGALFALTKEIKNQNEYRGYEIFGNEKLDYLAYTKYTKFSSGNPPSSNTLQMIMNAQTSELSFLIPNKEEFQSSASVYAQELEYLEKSNYNNSSSIEKTILSIIEKQTGINLYGYGADKKVVKLETSFNDDLTFIFKQIPKSQDESIKYWQFKAYGFIYQLYDVTPNIGKNLKGELKLYGDTFYYSENLNSLLNNEDNINWLNSEIKGFGIGDENSDIYLIDVLNPNGQTYDYNLKLSNIANCTAGTYLLNKDYKWENFGDNITNNLRFQYSKDDIEINSPLSTGTLYIVYDDEE